MPNKLCVFCKHFDYKEFDYMYYSTLTGGNRIGGFSCRAKHFYETIPDDLDEFRELINKAKKCKDYEIPGRSKK